MWRAITEVKKAQNRRFTGGVSPPAHIKHYRGGENASHPYRNVTNGSLGVPI